MAYRILADIILILHFCFIIFVVLGGVLLFRWPRLWRFHLPAVIWGVFIQYFMWSCPLTYLESYFRILAGEQEYEVGFIEYYFTTIVYAEITPEMHLLAGILLIAINLCIYLYVFLLKRSS